MRMVIRATTNYDMFYENEINRTVKENSKRYRDLVESMKDKGFLEGFPIQVVKNGNGKYKLKTGHHRLRVAAELGIPVCYVVVKDNFDIPEVEIGDPRWNLDDFLDAYAKAGIHDYQVVKEFSEETGLSSKVSADMFLGHIAGSRHYDRNQMWKKGNYKIKNYELPRLVGYMVVSLKGLGAQCATLQAFVSALSVVALVKEFSSERFLEQAEKYKYMIEKQKNRDAYVEMIEHIYNYRMLVKKKVKLARLSQDEREKRRFNKK